jgi:hypothetical protein
MGDSHSAHLWPGLSGALPDVNIMQASASMCRPVIPGPALFDMNFCPRMMRFVFNSFLIAHKVDRVLLAATWKDEDMPRLAHTLEVLTARGMEVVVLGPSSNTTGRFRACSPTKSAIVPPRSPAICAPPESPIATADLPNS